MEGRFARFGFGTVDVGAALDEELAELPVAVEARGRKAEIVAERVDGSAIGQKEFNGADVAVVRAMLEERDAVLVAEVAECPAAR